MYVGNRTERKTDSGENVDNGVFVVLHGRRFFIIFEVLKL